MRIIPPLKYKAAERLRFGVSLSRSGLEVEPQGGVLTMGPHTPMASQGPSPGAQARRARGSPSHIWGLASAQPTAY